jgi:hypothetical protein
MAQKQGDSLDEGIGLAIQKLLISPHFLFRIEQERKDAAAAQPVSEHELATRLSYFLWSSTRRGTAARDSAPATSGSAGRTGEHASGPRVRPAGGDFSGQWLQFRPQIHCRRKSFRVHRYAYVDGRGTALFFENLIRGPQHSRLVGAKNTFSNQRLADSRHRGPIRRVDLPAPAPACCTGSVLTVSVLHSHVVLRGKWVLENILNTPPPPPPADVPTLDEEAVGTSASLREQMEKHRANAICASCHSRMDPLGFALENFDAIGQFRAKDGKFPIDASGKLPDGRTFQGADGLPRFSAPIPPILEERHRR